MSDLSTIFSSSDNHQPWTLFIDRDGVINRKLENDYVKRWEEFEFIPGVIDALALLKKYFIRLVIVTNQRGIGRGLMTEDDLSIIHERMMEQILAGGGRIDGIYHAPDLAEHDTRGWRKPKTGMAFQAKEDFPEIKLRFSIVIGDSLSDMEFGRNAGMKTVWVAEESHISSQAHLIDLQLNSLPEFASMVASSQVPISRS